MKRRDFLKFIGIGGAGAAAGFVLGKVSKPPGAKLMPYLVPDENIIPGVPNWYASACNMCGAGCGVHVKVMEGRVKKIEGNPEHPVSQGRLCALGQAMPQVTYNPDRIKGPLKRRGERGTGEFMDITWEEAFALIAKNIGDLAKANSAAGLYLLTSQQRGRLGTLMDAFMSACGSSNHYQYSLFDRRNLNFANHAAMGIDRLPHYDMENSKYVLSFGADFTTWLSPVGHAAAYGQMRQSGKGGRGRLVQVEPRLSLTGANADEWVPAKPGTEAMLALSVAHAIVEKGWYRGGEVDGWRLSLSRYKPSVVAEAAEVSEERIYEMARSLTHVRPSLVVGGDNLASYQDGVSGLMAVNILNHLAGNIGATGGVIPNPAPAIKQDSSIDFKRRLSALAADAAKGKVKTLIICDTNPVFTTPVESKTREALRAVPFVVSLSSFVDETSVQADIILPLHTAAEDWGDDTPEPGVGYQVTTIMQPAVSPYYNTKGAGDIFLGIAKKMGGKAADRIKAASFAEYLKDSWREAYSRDRAMSSSALTFDIFWENLLKRGGWWPDKSKGAARRAAPVSARSVNAYLPQAPSRFEGADTEYPFYMILYPQAAYRDGRGANLPWLQELPDPMTSVVWGSWVDMNPKTAARLGVNEGDLVNIDSPSGSITVPVYIYPGIRPDTIAVPIGQGHSQYGRFARQRGVNPISILPFREDERSGAVALNATRVKVSSAGQGKLVKMEGMTRELGRGIIKYTGGKGHEG
ncbi:MAG: molybdopterin-dependent oxidoreductase [Deltaproteobacteria bacterium]|nr:molybdopterin-dependent oxidoreductase [Deltaproteobacteria bacterium]